MRDMYTAQDRVQLIHGACIIASSAILFRPMVIEHAKYLSTEKLAHSLHPLHPKPLGRLHPLCRLRYDLSKRVCVDVGLYTHPVHLLLLCSSILPHCSVT